MKRRSFLEMLGLAPGAAALGIATAKSEPVPAPTFELKRKLVKGVGYVDGMPAFTAGAIVITATAIGSSLELQGNEEYLTIEVDD